MSAQKDITGEKFGKLVAIKRDGDFKPDRWIFKCDCGTDKSIRLYHVKGGKINSCGCIAKSRNGLSQTRLYRVWLSMKKRCKNPSDHRFHRYGGRGISVCERWDEFNNFYEWSNKNGYQENLEIDRIDNDLGYFPENCRFVTRKENSNNKENTIYVMHDGEKKSLSKACEDAGLSYSMVQQRIYAGDEDIFRATHKTTFFGIPMTFAEAAKKFGVKERSIFYRIKSGLTPEQAVTREIARGKKL